MKLPPLPTDTRSRIVEVARRLFHEQGYHATGVSTILREADVNSGSLYHFFPSKEALLIAVLERYIEMMYGVLMAPVEAQTADPIERVFTLLANYREGLKVTDYSMGCPIGNLALELSDNHPPVRELIDANFRNWCGAIAGWLRSAGDRLPADVDRDALARFVLTVMEGAIMQSRAARSLTPFDDSVAALRQYFDRLTSDAGGVRRRSPTIGPL